MGQPASSLARRPAALLLDERLRPWLAALALAALVGVVYGPTVNLAFYEEDPSDFGEALGRPLGELFVISTSGLYYRPAHLAFFQLMSVPFDHDPRPAHLIRLGIHIANGVLLYLLLQRLWRQPLVSFVGAGLLAIHPMGVHAVARLTASQVPLVLGMLGALVLYLEARLSDSGLLAALAVAVTTITLLVQETAAVILPLALLLELYLVKRGHVARFEWKLLAAFGLAVAGFLLIWLQIEKSGSGFFEESFAFGAAVYLLQAAVYPIPRLLAALAADPPLALVAAVYALALVALGTCYALRGRALDFVLLLAFYLGVLAPPWAAKEFGYFIYGHRTLYVGLPWAASLWAGLLLKARPGRVRWLPPRWAAPLTLVILAGLGVGDSLSLVGLHMTGSGLMSQIVAAEARAGAEERLLFVNVPDRFTYRRQPYPIGDWGMIVAPISMDLSRYGQLRYGTAPQTQSLTAWRLAAGDVERTPYLVATRGPDSDPQTLYESARLADAVYMVVYRPDAFELREVGAVLPAPDTPSEALASFGEVAQLLDAEVEAAGETLRLRLRWLSLGSASPDDTVFVHVSGPGFAPVAQADGDALGGLLPLTAWQPGDIVEDRRLVAGLPPGEYAVIVGLYNRSTGERLPVTGSDEAIPGGVQVGQVSISG